MMYFSGLIVVICFCASVAQEHNITQVQDAFRNFILRSNVNSRQRMLMPTATGTHSLSPTKMPSRAINSEPFYEKWPKAKKIPFVLDDSYTQKERETIVTAMGQINTGTNNCVRFIPYDPQNQTDFLSITPLEDAGSLRFGCWSFPGKVWNQNGKGQLLGLTRGPTGCITSQREIMKTLVHAVGFRMVLNRPDRDLYVKINYDNMAPEWRVIDPYKKYSEAQVIYRSLEFDFNSITMHSPFKFSKGPTLPVYTPLEDAEIGTQAALSFWDCVGITTYYGCNPNGCPDPYGDGIPSGRSTPNGALAQPSSVRPATTTSTSIETTPATPDFHEEPDFTSQTSNQNPQTQQTTKSTTQSTTTEEETTEESTIRLTHPTRTTPKPRPLPPNIPTAPLEVPDLPEPVAPKPSSLDVIKTYICRPNFRVDSAVYSENGKIYLFSGQYYWTMDYRGDIIDAAKSILENFDGRVQPPVRSAWSDGKKTILVDASRKEITIQNEKFIKMDPSLFPKIGKLNEAFSYNTPAGPVVYYITNNRSDIQIGPEGTARKFSENVLAGLGNKIDAAFTIPLLGTQMVGMFAGNDFAYVTPCTMNLGKDPSPCFESVPIATWPVKFSNLVSFPSGNCRRRIRLKFPHFRSL